MKKYDSIWIAVLFVIFVIIRMFMRIGGIDNDIITHTFLFVFMAWVIINNEGVRE